MSGRSLSGEANEMLNEYGNSVCPGRDGGGGQCRCGWRAILPTFPALVAIFMRGDFPPDLAKVLANGTSTVGSFRASAASVWGYRQEFATTKGWIAQLLPTSLLGGTLGALLVTQLPERTFAFMVPWLILLAASLFTLQPVISRWFGIGQPHHSPDRKTSVGIVVFQLLVGIYAGDFGAGIGILMLAAFAMMGLSDIHAMNGLKSLLAGCMNGAAVVIFVASDKVIWPLAIAMSVAGCLVENIAAHTARRLPKALIRLAVIVIGFALAAYYFLQG